MPNKEKKYSWHKIAETVSELRFGKNNLMELSIAGKNICIANTLNGISACAAKCPHAGGIMAEGFLDKNGHIVCPVHRYTFNFSNGRDVTGEGYYLKIYPVRQNEEGVFIGMEEGGIFSRLK